MENIFDIIINNDANANAGSVVSTDYTAARESVWKQIENQIWKQIHIAPKSLTNEKENQ